MMSIKESSDERARRKLPCSSKSFLDDRGKRIIALRGLPLVFLNPGVQVGYRDAHGTADLHRWQSLFPDQVVDFCAPHAQQAGNLRDAQKLGRRRGCDRDKWLYFTFPHRVVPFYQVVKNWRGFLAPKMQ
jgi:hypothetical protein